MIILPLHQMKNVIIEPLVENSPRSLVPVETSVDQRLLVGEFHALGNVFGHYEFSRFRREPPLRTSRVPNSIPRDGNFAR